MHQRNFANQLRITAGVVRKPPRRKTDLTQRGMGEIKKKKGKCKKSRKERKEATERKGRRKGKKEERRDWKIKRRKELRSKRKFYREGFILPWKLDCDPYTPPPTHTHTTTTTCNNLCYEPVFNVNLHANDKVNQQHRPCLDHGTDKKITYFC